MKSFTPDAVAFDLDQTITRSKEPLSLSMAKALKKLAFYLPIAVVSGASRERMLAQLFPALPVAIYDRLTLLPTSGAALYTFKKTSWHAVYEHTIPQTEAERIMGIVNEVVDKSGLVAGEPAWGERLEFRGSQVTFSALGQQAPFSEKSKWDKDKKKRRQLVTLLSPRLKDYEVALGGTTTVDIVPRGINKALAVTKFAEHIHVPINRVLYVGDDLKRGGNDYVVAATTRAKTKSVANPADTLSFINELLEGLNKTRTSLK